MFLVFRNKHPLEESCTPYNTFMTFGGIFKSTLVNPQLLEILFAPFEKWGKGALRHAVQCELQSMVLLRGVC